MKYLITGSGGFIGYHLMRYIEATFKEGTLMGLQRNNKFCDIGTFYHDLRLPITKDEIKYIGKVDTIIHLAAMSHVDRSIKDPYGAVMDNVMGTFNILEYARKVKPKLFLYFSTDEVFGPNTSKEKFKEWDRFNPGSPYSATKAAAEDLCLAYHNTYNVPVIITHCMNVFGEGQADEKFIPKAIRLVKRGKIVPIYADKFGRRSGSRSYIHVDDVSRVIEFIIKNGKIGEKYNIPGTKEISNLYMAKLIAKTLGKPLKTKMITSDNVRPGNDFSYGIDGSKLLKMGWRPKENVYKRLKELIK